MPRAAVFPTEEFFLFGPLARWTADHDRAVGQIAGTVLRISRTEVVARLSVEPIEGVNRWRWVAAALATPSVVGTDRWAAAARAWRPSMEAGTVRVITAARFKDLGGGP